MIDSVLPDPDAIISAPGPWIHREVNANAARFHVAELGDGPPVLLLHGFPGFWWSWRHLMLNLADAGYRAIAMDLRGFGGSDHPPHGYDPMTLSADASGVLRSMGASQATIIGHGWGAMGAWAMAAYQPDVARRIVPISMPHPRALRRNLRHAGQWATLGYILDFQWPLVPERLLRRNDAARIDVFLRRWSARTEWIDDQSATYRAVFNRWPTPHTAVEPHRWMVRSMWRSDGQRFMSTMSTPIRADVLHIHGALDPMLLSASCAGSDAYVDGNYEFASLQCGHFPHEEDPAGLWRLLEPWLRERRGS